MNKQEEEAIKKISKIVEELFENYIPKDVIREKLKFYETLPNVGIFQSKEAIIRVLKELLGE